MALVVAALAPATVHATPPSPSGPPAVPPYLVTEIISMGGFAGFEIFGGTLINPGPPKQFWFAELEAHPASDLYVVRNTFHPGAQTGWHTHPGPSMITVTAGTITSYEGDDPTCTPHVYPAGSTFFDKGGPRHAHILRNEGSEPAVTVAVQIIPAGATRRIDVTPAPGNCPF